MITSIQLTVTEGPSLPASTLDRFVGLAARLGKTPDEFLAEIITKGVEDHTPQPQSETPNPKAA